MSGKFRTTDPKTTYFATGVPRGKDGKGEVVIIKRTYRESQMEIVQTLEGEKLSSYFGFSVEAADVNGDGQVAMKTKNPLSLDS